MLGFTDKAKEFPKDFEWLNTDKPLSLESLAGNIIILDFWTYCCINCMHMLPILAKIEEKYRKRGVVVIGVHSAKFENETDSANVREAVARYEVSHPVVVDKEMALWKAYGASAWPTLVFIGPDGSIAERIPGEVTLEQIDGIVSGLVAEYKRHGQLTGKPLPTQKPKRKAKAALYYPGKLAISNDGKRIAVSDSNNNRILVLDKSTGKVEAVIGSGTAGLSDGTFAKTQFFRPQGVLWAGNDTIYVTDTENHALRHIDMDKERVTTAAGTGKQAYPSTTAQHETGTSTALSSPWDLTHLDNKLYIAMAGLHQIWDYDIDAGTVGPFAGTGYENIEDGPFSEASFAQPSGIFAHEGHLYVADSEASAVRSIDMKDGFVGTLAGSGLFVFGDRVGKLQETLLQHPLGVCADKGTVYVADTYNHAIKSIDLKKNETFSLVSRKGGSVCRIDDPECDTLMLYEPSDVKLDKNMLYIADTNNHLVRTFDLKKKILSTLKITL